MRRGPKPAKSKEAKTPVARRSPKVDATRVRDLEKRLAEAREQQTATAEILRVISSSPTDLQPVFNTIVQSGLQLLGGYSAVMLLVQDDQFHLAAYTSTGTQGDDSVTRLFPIPMQEQPQVWRAVLEKRPVVVEDAETEPGFTEAMREMSRARGWRSSLQMPMMRDNNVIGLLNITRQDPGSFAQRRDRPASGYRH
jgi:two-component system, NtrC family, sensor kinase